MAGLVTKETDRSVDKFIQNIESASKQADSYQLLALIQEVTGLTPKVWGNDQVADFLIGFGNYRYQRKQGKEFYEWFHVGFAARKSKMTLYLNYDVSQEEELLQQLGRCKWGRGCLYLGSFKNLDMEVLRKLIEKCDIPDGNS